MFKNYIKVAIRNLLKFKAFSVLNILGLAVGMTCTILLVLFIQHELSYDDYHENADRIYRVAASYKLGGRSYEIATTPAPLAKTLLEEFPEVEKTVRFRRRGGNVIEYKNNVFKESETIYADNSVFDIFSINLLEGNKETVLIKPNTVAISQKAASKYFGKEDPIGKIIRVGDQKNFEVTGIFENIPINTHFTFDFILSIETIDESRELSWLGNNFNTYIVLNENSNVNNVESKFLPLLKKYLGPEIQAAMGLNWEELIEKGGNAAFYLQAVKDIHLHSKLDSELGTNSDIKYVYIFSLIAIFILVIAAINYINISTARATSRSKEVGIRKVLGSSRKELISQFLAESFITTLVSLLVSVGMLEIAMPFFNQLTGQTISLQYIQNPILLILAVAIVLFIGFLAGSYPAFVLSEFSPAGILREKKYSSKRFFRSGLVVFQFTTSIIMIIATLVVIDQLNYIQNKKLGFDKEHVLILTDAYLLGDQLKVFKNDFLKNEKVMSATVSGFLPVDSDHNDTATFPEGKPDELVAINNWSVDYDYVKTMKFELIEGRDFSEEFGTDDESIIVNESTVKLYGLVDPIGKRLSRFINQQGDFKTYNIIGVIKDFHFETFRTNIEPVMMYIGNNKGLISFRTTGENLPQLIDQLGILWKKFVPNQPFAYSFLDERFNLMYSAEQKTKDIFSVFASLTIFIGCLGLFSLAAFTAEQKTKEIGIRKVMGSSIFGIVYLLSGEFLKLVLISFIIAAPISYYFMEKWLTDFAYRTNISAYIFISAGFFVLLITILTVSYQAIKAALANPVDSLRNE